MMGSCTRRGTSARQSGGTDAEACAQAAADRRQTLADTAIHVRRPAGLSTGCPACQETLALLRRQNRLLERLLEAMGVEP